MPEPEDQQEQTDTAAPLRVSGFARRTSKTPEQIERQREIAKRLVAEGRFGGAKYGSLGGKAKAARKKRMQEELAEEARRKADVIKDRLNEMLDNNNPRIQLEAIKQYSAAEEWATKNQREEEKELLRMSGDELNELLMETLAEALGADIIIGDAEEMDAELLALVSGEAEGNGNGHSS